VVSNPRVWPEGRRTAALASSVDVVPTILSLAGVEPPAEVPPLRGCDLSPVLFDEHAEVQDAVLFTTDDDILDGVPLPGRRFRIPQPKSLRALRTRRWKLVRYHDPEGRVSPQHELYDLEADPAELDNLAAPGRAPHPELPALQARLDDLVAERFSHGRL
jgi:arylsulfatase A-like enzyme